MFRKINKDRLIGLLISVIVVLVFNLPSIVAIINTPSGMEFSGQNPWFDPWDINVYVSAIRWAQHNPFEYRNLYTTNHEPLPVIYPLYTTIGSLFPNQDAFILYNSLKILAGVFLVGITLLITKNLIKNNNEAMVATILTFFAGGFGWLILFNVYLPDIEIPSLMFISYFEKPHASLAIGFYFISLYFLYHGITDRKKSSIIYSSISLLPVILFYPYFPILYVAIITLYSIYLINSNQISLKKLIQIFLIIGIITIPFLIAYSSYIVSAKGLSNVFSPGFSTPNPIELFFAFGILAPFLIVQLFTKSKNNKLIFLNIWFFSSIVLSYFPLSFSRYYLRGLFYPAILITFLSLPHLSNRLRFSYSKLKTLIIMTVPVAPILVLALTISFAIKPSQDQDWVYLSKEKIELFEYLNDHSKPGEGVLVNNFITANQIPAHTHNSVYFGHKYQTPGSDKKQENQERLYSNQINVTEILYFFESNKINYILVSLESYSEIPFQSLEVVFKNDSYILLRSNRLSELNVKSENII